MSNMVVRKLRRLYQSYKNIRLINVKSLYKYWEQEHLKKMFSTYEVDCVFDVGANLGQYARMIRKETGFKGLIISFEPIPKAADILREKAKNDPNWIIVGHALSAEDGEQIFNIMHSSQFSSLSTPRHDEVDNFTKMNKVSESVTVKTETLASAFSRLKDEHNFKRPFLKLDTQGYDVEIIMASKDAVREFIGIQSELAIKKLYQHSMDFRETITSYQECGFTLSTFAPNNSGHFPILIETDCIMINNNLLP